ncbi:hypothetical protein PHMEG_00028101 [Phytophthora megakarya]|uniref:DDE Tnp4 domain-containing protein n=1 Tax=Phytophthora megakarya TaxID=4795 RepID=A0A225V5T7_9STRA|nr:hypothetical protein PHMEG_00028101 [Phytophthora megakarya]
MTTIERRDVAAGIAFLRQIRQERKNKLADFARRRAQERALRKGEDSSSEEEDDSPCPLFDEYLATGAPEEIMSMTKLSPEQFNVLWCSGEDHIVRNWNVGKGNKCNVAPKDVLFMTLSTLKVCGKWDIPARVFKIKCSAFEEMITKFLNLYVEPLADIYTMGELEQTGNEFSNFPCTRYATDEWAVLTDKGYQGLSEVIQAILSEVIRAIHPEKKKPGQHLSRDSAELNRRISSECIIVENCFGRLVSLWSICANKFRWKEDLYNTISKACVCGGAGSAKSAKMLDPTYHCAQDTD